MKVVHINIEAPFMDNSGYQETVLAECQKKMGHCVTIINNNHTLCDDGRIEQCDEKEYYSNAGVKIIRMRLYDKKGKKHIRIKRLYDILKNEKPDFIMVHGVFAFDVLATAKYIRCNNKNCIMIADCHATRDNANIMNNNLKNVIFRGCLKVCNKYMQMYYKKVYGIVDDAVDIMIKYAGISPKKTAVLGLGYDESLIDLQHQDEIRNTIRKKYNIPEKAILIAHGGKLNNGKKTLELIQAADECKTEVHILVFGNFENDTYKKEVETACDSLKVSVVFTGALKQKDIYNVYLASDIAAFPGTASCLRQQAVASGLPLIMGYNDADKGINLNMNGNAICLLKGWKVNDLSEAIEKMCSDSAYRKNAQELGRGEYRKYSYQWQAQMLINLNN